MVGGGVTVGSSSPAVVRSPLRIARCGARSNRRSQATVRSPILKPLPDCPFVRRHVRETDNRIGLRFGPRPGADPIVHHTSKSSRCHGGTPVRSRCVGRCAERAQSQMNNSGIDARNGQAYHGRKTIATHGTRPAAWGSRSDEGQRAQWQQRRRLTSRVRSRAGVPGRT